MELNLKDVVSWLADNDYLVVHKSRYLLTAKFNQELTGENIGIQVIAKPEVKQTVPKLDWIADYQRLIIEANIPRMSDNGKGGQYQINTATKPGREAFKKAVIGGATYEALLQALRNYYGTPKSYLVKVEKFFVDELWRDQQTTQSNGARAKFF